MRVLITGHLGFTGPVMVPFKQKAGREVTGFNIGLYDKCDFGLPRAPSRGIRADLRDADCSLLKGFAALSKAPLGDLDAQLTCDINRLTMACLASFAREACVGRFRFSSSYSNFRAACGTVFDENSHFNPVAPCGILKVGTETDLLKLVSEGFSAVLLRSATACDAPLCLPCDIVFNNQSRRRKGQGADPMRRYALASGRSHRRHLPRLRRRARGAA
jgi:nucleoside-diphosphate-sugar epimerase